MARPVAAQPFSTERLELLPLSVEHADEMVTVLGDPALHQFIGGEPLGLLELRSRFGRLAAGSPDSGQGWLNWVVRLRASGELTGTVQATVQLATTIPYAEVAWVVGRPWQGRGIASEAAVGLAEWLRANGIDRLVAHIHPTHAGSAGVARRVGLEPTDRVVDGEIEWVRGWPASRPRADASGLRL